MNANEEQFNSTSSKLLEIEDIPNTPFKCVGSEETGYFIAMGSYRMTEPAETPAKAEDKLYTEQWDIIARLISVIVDINNQINKIQ